MGRRERCYLTLGLVAGLAGPLTAEPPQLVLFPEFADLQVTPLRLDGPLPPGGTAGLDILEADALLNGQSLPAGTILSMFGTVAGGQNDRVYAVDPRDGRILPDLSVSYAPAALDGHPDAGLLLLPEPGRQFLGIQFSPMAVFLGEFEPDGPGLLRDIEYLPPEQFPNGGGLGLADEDTLYLTSWQAHALYTVDFAVADGALTLSNLTLVSDAIAGLGPDGVALIPPNAAGALAGYAGNLLLAQFGGNQDGFLTVVDRSGQRLTTVARYRKNDGVGFLGPDGVTFGLDGTLYVSDFGQTIFKVGPVPEAGTLGLLLVGLGCLGRPGRRA